ncbi:hypothetical protein TNCV_5040861 [Trichonephila clavipes]|nr:hypothetical protein TNCV_5040861 [Trichonephila clavipes]
MKTKVERHVMCVWPLYTTNVRPGVYERKEFKTVVSERRDPFRRPLIGKFRALSPLSARISGSCGPHPQHPVTSYWSAGIKVPRGQGVETEVQGGPRNNLRAATSGCTCDDHFHKRKSRPQLRSKTRQYLYFNDIQNIMHEQEYS